MKRGFSLLEIALAIALMAIAILAIILVFTRGMSLMSASSRVTKASEFGRQFLEVWANKKTPVRATGDQLVLMVFDSLWS